jgi:hypothetical protein
MMIDSENRDFHNAMVELMHWYDSEPVTSVSLSTRTVTQESETLVPACLTRTTLITGGGPVCLEIIAEPDSESSFLGTLPDVRVRVRRD